MCQRPKIPGARNQWSQREYHNEKKTSKTATRALVPWMGKPRRHSSWTPLSCTRLWSTYPITWELGQKSTLQKTPGSIRALFTTSQGGSDHGVTGFPKSDKEEATGEQSWVLTTTAASVGRRTGVWDGGLGCVTRRMACPPLRQCLFSVLAIIFIDTDIHKHNGYNFFLYIA